MAGILRLLPSCLPKYVNMPFECCDFELAQTDSSALCPKPAAPFHFWLTAAACCKTFACHNLCASHVNPGPESFAKCHNQLVEVLRYFQDPCQPYYASNSRN